MLHLKNIEMKLISILFILIFTCSLRAQVEKAPDRVRGEGPYSQLIIRGVTLVDGTGSPPFGPVDIVIEENKIVNIRVVGNPGVPINEKRRPQLKEGGHEIDAYGKYVLPGFVDMHGHIGGRSQGADAEYVFKLWLAHGITTIRDPSCGNGLDWVLDQKRRSNANEIAAPRIYAYTVFGQGQYEGINSAEEAKKWVQENANKGADGIKFFGASPPIMDAALRENRRLGLRSACHHAQLDVARWNVMQSAEAGLTSMEHWYGLPEALFEGRTIQNYPADYNYYNEQDRFREAGRLWKQAAEPFSDHWNMVMDSLIAMNFTLDPTFNIYEANRDLHRARRQEWHEEFTMPNLWRFYQPSRISHGSYWHDWGTEEELIWKENYRLWMTFVNEYKNRGGRVTTGSDSGFIYQLYGFAYVRELELLREAGFHPLEVIRAATLYGAEALGVGKEIGSIEIGKLADLIIIDENPLRNFKYLYGTGAVKLSPDNEIYRAGIVDYTIKDGVVYDAELLLDDVRNMVKAAKTKEDFEIRQPGIKEE